MKYLTFLIMVVLLFAFWSASTFTNEVTLAKTQLKRENENQSFPVSKLREALAKTRSVLQKERADIKPQYVKLPNSQQSLLSGYYSDVVLGNIQQGKTTLISALDVMPDLAGYRAHVQEFYPQPELTFIAFTKDNRSLVSVESTNKSYSKVFAYIEKMEASTARPVIDLNINSTPSIAYFELWIDGGESARTLTTNNPMQNIYRGYYLYRVTKSDYKKIEGKLDLINGDGTMLDCIMHKSDDRDGPYPCSLK